MRNVENVVKMGIQNSEIYSKHSDQWSVKVEIDDNYVWIYCNNTVMDLAATFFVLQEKKHNNGLDQI